MKKLITNYSRSFLSPILCFFLFQLTFNHMYIWLMPKGIWQVNSKHLETCSRQTDASSDIFFSQTAESTVFVVISMSLIVASKPFSNNSSKTTNIRRFLLTKHWCQINLNHSFHLFKYRWKHPQVLSEGVRISVNFLCSKRRFLGKPTLRGHS